jgi:hypothetical protein
MLVLQRIQNASIRLRTRAVDVWTAVRRALGGRPVLGKGSGKKTVWTILWVYKVDMFHAFNFIQFHSISRNRTILYGSRLRPIPLLTTSLAI